MAGRRTETSQPGEPFERDVASVYRALGFETQHDVLLDGNQVDVLATYRMPGAPPGKIVIEAKWVESPDRRVKKDTVATYLPVARNLLSAGLCNAVVVVSNRNFTRFAKELVRDEPNIELVTLRDLEQQLIFGTPQLARQVAIYLQSSIGQLFVEPQVRWATDLSEQTSPSTPFAGLDLARSFTGPERAPVVLFADYGAGKSTLLERIKFVVLSQAIDGDSSVLPILFLLKEYDPSGTLDQYVRGTCARELGRDLEPSAFWELLDQQRLFLLLDGFDEIATAPTSSERIRLLEQLAPLLFSRSPVLLSTRPSYFTSRRDLDRAIRLAAEAGGVMGERNQRRTLLGSEGERALASLRESHAPRGAAMQFGASYRLAELLPLDPSSISEYLHQFDSDWAAMGLGDGDDIQAFLDTIYDLTDLITRPLLLRMIVEMIQGGFLLVDEQQTLGPAQLYEIYIEMKLIVDFDKGGPRVKGESEVARRAFAEQCAVAMLKNGALEMDAKAASAIAGRVGGHKSSQESLLTDYRTCSFLSVTSDGRYKFVHKSFYEFFLACCLFDAIDAEDWDLLGRQVPGEALMFLGSMLQTKPKRSTKAVGLLRQLSSRGEGSTDGSERSNAAANLVSAALWGSVDIHDIKLSDIDVPPARVGDIEFSDSELERVRFVGMTGSSLAFAGSAPIVLTFGLSTLDVLAIREITRAELSLERSKVREIVVEMAKGKVDLSSTEIDTLKVIDNADLDLTGRAGGRVRSVACEKSQLLLSGATAIDRLEASNSLVRVEGDFSASTIGISKSGLICRLPDLGNVSKSSGAVTSSVVVVDGNMAAAMSSRLDFRECLVIVDPGTPLRALTELSLVDCCVLGGFLELPTRRVKPDERIQRQAVLERLGRSAGIVFVKGDRSLATRRTSTEHKTLVSSRLRLVDMDAEVTSELRLLLQSTVEAVRVHGRGIRFDSLQRLSSGIEELGPSLSTSCWLGEFMVEFEVAGERRRRHVRR